MIYHVPLLKFGKLMPPQATLVDKFGGLPWGLPKDLWPHCNNCGKPQSHLAQLEDEPARFNLGERGRVLLLFQCDNKPATCATWQANSGANACILLERTELGVGLTDPPHSDTPIELEARVVRWEPKDENIASENHCYFIDNERGPSFDDEIRYGNIGTETKVGAAPYWIQPPGDTVPPPPWRFALQLNSHYRFEGHFPAFSADEVGCSITRKIRGKTVHEYPKHWPPGRPRWISVEDDYWMADAANLGDGGMAYVFVHIDKDSMSALMFSQSL